MHSSIRNFNAQTQRIILAQQEAHTFINSNCATKRAAIAKHYAQHHSVTCLQTKNLRCNKICTTFSNYAQKYAMQNEA